MEDVNNWKLLMNKNRAALGRRIRDLRKSKGKMWTIAYLAGKVGLSENGLRYIEQGKRWPRGENLELIAKHLGVSISTLFEGLHSIEQISPLKEATEVSLKQFEKLIDSAIEKLSKKQKSDESANVMKTLFEKLNNDQKVEIADLIRRIAGGDLPMDSIPKEMEEIEVFRLLKAQKQPKLFQKFLLVLTADIDSFFQLLSIKNHSSNSIDKRKQKPAESQSKGPHRRSHAKGS